MVHIHTDVTRTSITKVSISQIYVTTFIPILTCIRRGCAYFYYSSSNSFVNLSLKSLHNTTNHAPLFPILFYIEVSISLLKLTRIMHLCIFVCQQCEIVKNASIIEYNKRDSITLPGGKNSYKESTEVCLYL